MPVGGQVPPGASSLNSAGPGLNGQSQDKPALSIDPVPVESGATLTLSPSLADDVKAWLESCRNGAMQDVDVPTMQAAWRTAGLNGSKVGKIQSAYSGANYPNMIKLLEELHRTIITKLEEAAPSGNTIKAKANRIRDLLKRRQPQNADDPSAAILEYCAVAVDIAELWPTRDPMLVPKAFRILMKISEASGFGWQTHVASKFDIEPGADAHGVMGVLAAIEAEVRRYPQPDTMAGPRAATAQAVEMAASELSQRTGQVSAKDELGKLKLEACRHSIGMALEWRTQMIDWDEAAEQLHAVLEKIGRDYGDGEWVSDFKLNAQIYASQTAPERMKVLQELESRIQGLAA
jgi:hypothetical protein